MSKMKATPKQVADLAAEKLRAERGIRTSHIIAGNYLGFWDTSEGMDDKARNLETRRRMAELEYMMTYPDVNQGVELAERLLAKARQELEAS